VRETWRNLHAEEFIICPVHLIVVKGKVIPVESVVAFRVVRGWGSHNLQTFGSQMVAR
jgi:hypothetical protein